MKKAIESPKDHLQTESPPEDNLDVITHNLSLSERGPSMKLYFSPGACSLAPHIVLEELGMSYHAESVDLASKKTSSGKDYNQINPKGSVPSLELNDGGLLTECAVLLQYLCDQHPDKELLPKAGTEAHYRCLEWMNYIATEIHKGLGSLFAAERMFPQNAEMARDFKIATLKMMDQKLSFLNSHFKTSDYLMGSQYTAADAYLFVILGWSKWLKVDMSKYPSLFAFMERMMGRPAVQKAMKKEGLLQ